MKLRQHLDALTKARDEYHKKANTLTPPEIAKEVTKFKELNKAISDAITDGAQPCKDCKGEPTGIFHDGTANPFEIGCLACANHRVREALPEDAVDKWNKGEYLPPRPSGTALATHRDVTGQVKSEKLVKVHAPQRK